MTRKLQYQMSDKCTAKVSHFDEKGFVYCKECRLDRRRSGVYCRALRAWELRTLESGNAISYPPGKKPQSLAAQEVA